MVDVVTKPTVGVVDKFPKMMADLRERVKAAALVDVSRYARMKPSEKRFAPIEADESLHETTDRVIAIGASAGGWPRCIKLSPCFRRPRQGLSLSSTCQVALLPVLPNGLIRYQLCKLKRLNRETACVLAWYCWLREENFTWRYAVREENIGWC